MVLTPATADRIEAELRRDPARPDLTIAAKLDLKSKLVALVRFKLEAIADPEARLHSYRRGVHASIDCWCRFAPPAEVQEPPPPPEPPAPPAVTLSPTPRPTPKPKPNPPPVNPRKLDTDDDWIIVTDWPERPPATAEQLQAHFSNRERQRASVARTRR